MTFDEACHIKNPNGISFDTKLDSYVRYVGRDVLEPLIPFNPGELAMAYLEDRSFNNLPPYKWTAAAGYPAYKDSQSTRVPKNTGRLGSILVHRGITLFSMSECVCLLKHCAAMMAMDWLRELVGRLNSKEAWAVFENQQPDADALERWYNIFDFDCVAVFATEPEAIAYENKKPGIRVRKKIPVIGKPDASKQ